MGADPVTDWAFWVRLGEWLAMAFGAAFHDQLRLTPFYMSGFVAIAFLVWLLRGRPRGFLAWLLPARIYFHRSHLMDIQVFLIGRLVAMTGVLSRVVFTSSVTVLCLAFLVAATGGIYDPPPITMWRLLATTLIVVVTVDFCGYWVHRLHHDLRALWPFHALHHSAEVMTPITAYRRHPVYDLVIALARSVLLGLAQGAVLFLLMGSLDVATIGGANAITVIYTLAVANFNHSHIWISYGRVLNHVFISPAQHQIHHSIAPRHHNRNYGDIFALWDWMFGTLYVPERHETLRFGLADSRGNPLPQAHPTLRAAMLHPFHDSWRVLALRRRGLANGAGGTTADARRVPDGDGIGPDSPEPVRAPACDP